MSVSPANPAVRRNRLPGSGRLRHAADYQAVFDKAVRAADQRFTLLARPNHHGRARLGLVVSARAAGNAVRRNRIKRAARESFRNLQHELGDIDVVVLARPGAGEAAPGELNTSLTRLLRSLSRKCAESSPA